jgi:hypothetical protein
MYDHHILSSSSHMPPYLHCTVHWTEFKARVGSSSKRMARSRICLHVLPLGKIAARVPLKQQSAVYNVLSLHDQSRGLLATALCYEPLMPGSSRRTACHAAAQL